MTCRNCGNNVADQLRFCPKCGTPVPATAYVPPVYEQPAWQSNAPAPPVKRKSSLGKILLIVGIIFVLLGSGIGLAIYFGVRSYLKTTKSSEAYAIAETRLRESTRVKSRMGEIKNIGMPIGTSKEESDGTGFAAFVMSVEGEKASGQYVVAMDRRNATWIVLNANVQLTTGEEINVLEELEDDTLLEPAENNDNRNDNRDLDQDQNTNTANSNNSNRKPTVVSGGVLNGKAISLPKPTYPPVARSTHASGTVVVEVTIDEQGKVISASAVSGHPLLRASAVSAARQARFSPTLLSGSPVKVTGRIIYNFVAEP